eukprot:COSAG04_NODE_8126_length_1020_cov_1.244300_2_plen_89_part_00
MTRIVGEFEPILTERLARLFYQIWNNNVDVVNSNFEWNRIGIAIDAGDDVNIAGNDIEGHGGAQPAARFLLFFLFVQTSRLPSKASPT